VLGGVLLAASAVLLNMTSNDPPGAEVTFWDTLRSVQRPLGTMLLMVYLAAIIWRQRGAERWR
jgi:hypothetical protein